MTCIPDDVIPLLPITPKPDALWVLASGYAVAFDRIDPNCDVGMVPRTGGLDQRFRFFHRREMPVEDISVRCCRW